MSINISVNGPYTPGDIYFGDCHPLDRVATDAEATAYKTKQDKDQANSAIFTQIALLELKQARSMRESVLTGDLTRLQGIENQIVVLRAQLKL